MTGVDLARGAIAQAAGDFILRSQNAGSADAKALLEAAAGVLQGLLALEENAAAEMARKQVRPAGHVRFGGGVF